jgi:hypothetical protein
MDPMEESCGLGSLILMLPGDFPVDSWLSSGSRVNHSFLLASPGVKGTRTRTSRRVIGRHITGRPNQNRDGQNWDIPFEARNRRDEAV